MMHIFLFYNRKLRKKEKNKIAPKKEKQVQQKELSNK